MIILDGKQVSKKIRLQVKEKVSLMEHAPCLMVILVGGDPASQIYVASKEKACLSTNIIPKTLFLDENITEEDLLKQIDIANIDKNIHALLVQMPLPKHINEKNVINAIDPKKDVDGLHIINQGKLFLGLEGIIPATPKGIMHLFHEYNISLSGKNALVIGRSMLVGKPIAQLLLQENATVTMAHSRSKNLVDIAKTMDIIVCAVGRPRFLTADMVKDGAVVIDVGINRENNKVVGDVDYDNVSLKTSFITPVPGSVGPMTIACLLENTLECYYLQNKK